MAKILYYFKYLGLISTISFICFLLQTCNNNKNVLSAETSALQDSVESKAQNIFPSADYSIFAKKLASISGDTAYFGYLSTLNQAMDSFALAVQQIQNASLPKKTAVAATSLPTISPAAINQMQLTLNQMFGDISSQGQKAFLNAGMGFGQGVLGGAGGSISGTFVVGVGFELDAGAGFERTYDFLHFQTAYFPVSECSGGIVISFGEGGGVSGQVEASYYENWIFGFQKGVLQDYQGASIGGSDAGSIEGALGLGLGVNGGIGQWYGIDAPCNLISCPTTTSIAKSSLSGFNYAIGLSFSGGIQEKAIGAISGSLTSGCVGSALNNKSYVESTLPVQIRYVTAGLNMGKDILLNAIESGFGAFDLPRVCNSSALWFILQQ